MISFNRLEFRYPVTPQVKKKAWQAALTAFVILWMLSNGIFILMEQYFPLTDAKLPVNHMDLGIHQDLGRSNWSRLFLRPWYRWDTVHYLRIANEGYREENSVWPPVYPLLMRSISLFTHSNMLSGWLISAVSTLIAFYLLYLLIWQIWGKVDLAQQTLMFLIAFPASFFLLGVYTESLFLVLALVSLSAAVRQDWLLSGTVAAIAALTRLQGVFLVLPLVWIFYEQVMRGKRFDLNDSIRRGWPIALPALALGGFFLFVRFGLDFSWPWQTLSAGWDQKLAFPGGGIYGNLRGIILSESFTTWEVIHIIELIIYTWMIACLVHSIRHDPYSLSVYSIVYFVLLSVRVNQDGSMVSSIRYLLTIFPLFISEVRLLKNGTVRGLIWGVLILLQVITLTLFYHWSWVS
ncbi:MAG: hypothetical protein JW750_08200 [Anaerolineaceae bacterium]|nr:hypothetical protein [Anaerolineaceae bacterium]